jgi:uncharacterized membrane protein
LWYWVFQHWLALLNGLVLVYGGLPWLAPLFIDLGYRDLGLFIFQIYTPLCHQNPDNSFFLLGHQVAFCYRETAMYTALFVGGLIYAGVRNRLRPISLRLMFVLLLPLVLDGATHSLGSLVPALDIRGPDDSLWSFNWWVRMISGVLFAVGVILGIYTRLDRDLRGVGENDRSDGIHIRAVDAPDAPGAPE